MSSNSNNNNNNNNSTESGPSSPIPPVDLYSVPTNRPVRVYVDGIYDLFHFGHARSLEQAKKLFPNTFLLVGVCNDAITHKMKGKTVMTDKERYESVRHCRWADEVVEDAPWVVNQEFLDQHSIDFVAHGEDMCYDADGNDVYAFVKSQGRFKTIKRTDGISTSDLILRIVKDYDSYVKRNLKRGYKAEDMNVPYLKAKRFQVEEKVNDAVGKISQWSPIKPWVKGFGDQWERLVHHFEHKETPTSSTPASPLVSPLSPSYPTSSGEESSGDEDNNHHTNDSNDHNNTK
eukprot:TRINITY_DN1220_c0_g2_i1.p1 TRINITY_DN1220_c0_g2~~TRINITY_DN1220_c0_g2_i1.p1  ORF type:complete len:289 (+),score=61.14 TRINITY_DN1220_c0_g2_i1:83-949(+)